jgi:hypothetical protein
MSLSQLQYTIDQKATEAIRNNIVPLAVSSHIRKSKNRNWVTCDCEWCVMKRKATFDIGCINIPADLNVDYIRSDDFDDRKRQLRENIRVYYRGKLRELES